MGPTSEFRSAISCSPKARASWTPSTASHRAEGNVRFGPARTLVFLTRFPFGFCQHERQACGSVCAAYLGCVQWPALWGFSLRFDGIVSTALADMRLAGTEGGPSKIIACTGRTLSEMCTSLCESLIRQVSSGEAKGMDKVDRAMVLGTELSEVRRRARISGIQHRKARIVTSWRILEHGN